MATRDVKFLNKSLVFDIVDVCVVFCSTLQKNTNNGDFKLIPQRFKPNSFLENVTKPYTVGISFTRKKSAELVHLKYEIFDSVSTQ